MVSSVMLHKPSMLFTVAQRNSSNVFVNNATVSSKYKELLSPPIILLKLNLSLWFP